MTHRELAESLHSAYCDATGNHLRMNYLYQSAWTEFIDAKWTRDDLLTVINFTRKKMAAGENGFNQQSLLLRVLSNDGWLKFDERLNAARQEQRRREPKPRTEQTIQRVGDIRRTVEQPTSLEPDGVPELVRTTLANFKREMRGDNFG